MKWTFLVRCMIASMAFVGVAALAEATTTLQKQFISSPSASYSNAVTVSAGDITTIYISGQVGFLNGELPQDFTKQTENMFENLSLQLKAAGASLNDIVKTNIYIVNLDAEKFKIFSAVRKQYFTQTDMPASTLVGVQALVYPSIHIEIDAVAVIK